MRSDKIEELMDIYETLVDAGVTFYYEDEEISHGEVTSLTFNEDDTVDIELDESENFTVEVKDFINNAFKELLDLKQKLSVYENKLLGEVLEDLERWYDVEVFVMHDEIRNLHLTANLPKYENMDKVLEIIEYAACVKFEVKGRTVVVRRD